MVTDELTQALVEQRTNHAETNMLQVIANVLELDVGVVYRVLYAAQNVQLFGLDWRNKLSGELRAAINDAMDLGARRVTVAQSIRAGRDVKVRTSALVPDSDKVQICRGCPERLPCVMDQLHTPDDCYTALKTTFLVTPIRMTGTTVDVEAKQPAGWHTVPLTSVEKEQL